ncbi:MAG: hypothetical protein HRT77_14305 [Halioglobus sp.]|nr:hypothetical protein [Halioglobus sp.]
MGPSDRQRQLTESGCDDIGFACRQFHAACRARRIPPPGTILHSPWLRTTQTAEIIAGAFTQASLQAEDALQPESDASAVDIAIGNLTAQKRPHAVLVSHQPLVSHIAEFYLGTKKQVPALTPGGLCTLSFEVNAQACGVLEFWALPPEYEVGI